MSEEIFNKPKALELVDNDEELLSILLNTFLETEFNPNQLVTLINSKNYEEAASYTHRVKGAGRQIAAEKVAKSGQDLEDVLRRKKNGDIKTLVNQFYQDYKEAVTEIKKHV